MAPAVPFRRTMSPASSSIVSLATSWTCVALPLSALPSPMAKPGQSCKCRTIRAFQAFEASLASRFQSRRPGNVNRLFLVRHRVSSVAKLLARGLGPNQHHALLAQCPSPGRFSDPGGAKTAPGLSWEVGHAGRIALSSAVNGRRDGGAVEAQELSYRVACAVHVLVSRRLPASMDKHRAGPGAARIVEISPVSAHLPWSRRSCAA